MTGKTNNRMLLGVAAIAVGIMFVLGWSFAPSFMTSVSAANQETAGGATTEMLNYALNFRSASNLAVFGGNSVSDNGSEIRGVVGSTGDVTGVSANAMDSGDQAAARRDLSDVFAIVDQLPCTQVSGDLSGQTFAPGVYCVGSATLAGRMTVDAGGDENARFVFRVDGTFRAEDAAGVIGQNGARATNVYIFARQSATIGANATIASSVISREDVTVGNGSTVSGKVIGVNGDVVTNANIVAAGTGYIEICKQLAEFDRIPVGTIFNFNITGVAATIQVPAGAWGSPNCSPPIQVAAGQVTVTEQARANTAVVDIAVRPASRTISKSNELQQVSLNVPAGDVADETVVTYTNQTTRTGTIEICKFGLDDDVSGFFNFTVVGAPGQVFSVPVGFCSGPITLTLLQQNAGPSPQPTQAFQTIVTELAQPTYRCENVTTFPANALVGWVADFGFYGDRTPILPNNNNGCYALVNLNVAGGAANQTTVRFYNRSLPGRIKVCKITADTVNIPVGTAFEFMISGQGWTSPIDSTPVGRTYLFDVLAGPASQGGFCAFAPDTWRVGDPLFVGERSINMATNTTVLPLDKASNGGYTGFTATLVRTSSITSSTAFLTLPQSVNGTIFPFPTTVSGINPNIKGSSFPFFTGYGVIAARNAVAEMTFTNFVYRPAILKLCKAAGPGVAVGTEFTFTIAPADPATTWPYPTGKITVKAGSCVFVNGPFPEHSQFPGVGLFNFGTSIIVTEDAAPGTTIQSITSPTLTAVGGFPNYTGSLGVDLINRRGTLTLNHVLGIPVPPQTPANYYFNELTFTNVVASAPPTSEARFDFDGDHRSDVAVFRPSDGNWYYSPSSSGGARAVHFGSAGDIPMAADYDGDGTTDVAVFRPTDGNWYILGSTAGFQAIHFGATGDVPMAADFDGDGNADVAVFRPSDGNWYINGSAAGFSAIHFGITGDIPVAADFDGDSKADVAVFRPSDGTWYINGSTTGFTGVQFGTNGDIPVGADYDGDGKADTAVFRPSTGTWYKMGSSTGFSAVQFGTAGDTPVPADYDGDGKTDVGVYRTSDRTWYILNSSQLGNAVGGLTATYFGADGDLLGKY